MGTESSGKRGNQKLKPYIVLQILQRETDENYVLSAVEIAAALIRSISWPHASRQQSE